MQGSAVAHWVASGVRGLAVLGVVLGLAATSAVTQAKSNAVIDSSSIIALAQLPKSGQQTYALIFKGGPFAFDKDGTVFGNFERILPRQQRGYYREYTVETPGLGHRGARRIVTGGQPPTVYYYTDDHYDSFRSFELPQ